MSGGALLKVTQACFVLAKLTASAAVQALRSAWHGTGMMTTVEVGVDMETGMIGMTTETGVTTDMRKGEGMIGITMTAVVRQHPYTCAFCHACISPVPYKPCAYNHLFCNFGVMMNFGLSV